MPFGPNRRTVLQALSAFAGTSALLWFGNGLEPLWPLLWFAPLPVLLFALRSSWRAAALTAGFAWFAGSFNLWHYFRELQTPVAVWLAIFSGSALIFALDVLLFRALVRQRAYGTAVLAFPAAWVVFEYARNLLTPHGTAGALAYSQLNFLPFLQLASITGPWGMSFLLLSFPAALAVAFYVRRSAPRQALRLAIPWMGIIALALIFGAIRMLLPESQQRTTVGLVAFDVPNNVGIVAAGAGTDRLFRAYAVEAGKLAARGAQVIVLPEKIGVVRDADVANADQIFQQLVDTTGAVVVVGEIQVAQQLKYNRARIYAPGFPVATYDKHHMLPPFESDLEAGTALTILPRRFGEWGVAICKDLDFTPLSRHYGQAGIGLMLAPAWDFRLDRWWHGHIAIMRGVESGFSVARAARDGNLTVSDYRGRILAETGSDSAPFATLLVQTPSAHHATLYLLLGDWFAWLAIAAFAFALVQLVRAPATQRQ